MYGCPSQRIGKRVLGGDRLGQLRLHLDLTDIVLVTIGLNSAWGILQEVRHKGSLHPRLPTGSLPHFHHCHSHFRSSSIIGATAATARRCLPRHQLCRPQLQTIQYPPSSPRAVV